MLFTPASRTHYFTGSPSFFPDSFSPGHPSQLERSQSDQNTPLTSLTFVHSLFLFLLQNKQEGPCLWVYQLTDERGGHIQGWSQIIPLTMHLKTAILASKLVEVLLICSTPYTFGRDSKRWEWLAVFTSFMLPVPDLPPVGPWCDELKNKYSSIFLFDDSCLYKDEAMKTLVGI